MPISGVSPIEPVSSELVAFLTSRFKRDVTIVRSLNPVPSKLLPKRAHHHIGIEHMIASELMVAKLQEAVRARRDPSFLIIGRTNALNSSTMDDALRRAENYRAAGADMLLVPARKPEHFRHLGERLAPPLMAMLTDSGLKAMQMTKADLTALGFRLFVDPVTPLLVLHQTLRQCYQAIARGEPAAPFGSDSVKGEHKALHATIDLEALLAIERATVEQ